MCWSVCFPPQSSSNLCIGWFHCHHGWKVLPLRQYLLGWLRRAAKTTTETLITTKRSCFLCDGGLGHVPHAIGNRKKSYANVGPDWEKLSFSWITPEQTQRRTFRKKLEELGIELVSHAHRTLHPLAALVSGHSSLFLAGTKFIIREAFKSYFNNFLLSNSKFGLYRNDGIMWLNVMANDRHYLLSYIAIVPVAVSGSGLSCR